MKSVWLFMFLLIILCASAAFADGYSEYQSGDYMAGPYMGDIAVVCTKSITIRSEPSYSGKKVQSASNGDQLYVHSQYNNWVEVTYTKNGTDYSGWVIGSYIVIRPMTIMLRSSNIPAYCAPDRSAKIVGSLPKQTELTVLGTYGDFYVVSLRDASAFIAKDADVFTSNELYYSIYNSPRRVVTSRDTRMYSGPGTEWNAVLTIPGNTTVICGASYDGWIVVQYDGEVGFISESDVYISYSDEGNG